VLFRRAGLAVTTAQFVAEAAALAERLPPGQCLLNLCRDRYHFALAFAAALLRGQVSLLTGERAAAPLAALAARHPGCAVALDDAATEVPPGLPQLWVAPAGAAPAITMPMLEAAQPAAVIFTSGSTGAPAGHAKRWGALVVRCGCGAERFGFSEEAPMQLVGTVPPQHMYGFETTVMQPLHGAAASWCGPAFFPEDVRAALAAVPAPRLLITTPLQLRTLLRSGVVLPELAAVLSATAPLETELAAEAEARWAAPVREIFGATEVGSIATRRTVEGPVWRLYPDLTLAEGMLAAPWCEPTPLDDEVALEPGGFRLLGRRQDIVKLAGRRASLAGLNRALLEIPGVADGCFVVPPDLDQRSTARLLAAAVAPELTAAALMEELRSRLDPVFLPRRLVLLPALPRNEFGKLSREKLMDLLAGEA
jgi:acyl-coenzyme A synthetase/AMP-(fatty) acid ligase